MKKLWLLLYYGLVPLLFWAFLYDESVFLKKAGFLEVVSNLILITYYIRYKNSKFVLIDWYSIEALLFTCAGGILILIFRDLHLLMFLNTVGFYLTQFMYISIFRDEGSILPPFSSVIKEWKMIFLTILFFIGLVFLLITYTPNSLLLISFVYSTQMMVLCWMAYFRPIPRKAYSMGFIGIFLLVMSNLWLAINLLYKELPYKTGVYFIIYATSQLLIIESILYTRNKVEN
ncbi:lysoplasmalogenase family protein [Emticicia aquatilis]|uniref:lysoplasmalogenase family protein n=1 Tax=Emticicia aquatilis TaxID=1537369 RepID=UPI001667F076|nr:lysoplasmalogenase family protein [Emticicia aquatilis]